MWMNAIIAHLWGRRDSSVGCDAASELRWAAVAIEGEVVWCWWCDGEGCAEHGVHRFGADLGSVHVGASRDWSVCVHGQDVPSVSL